MEAALHFTKHYMSLLVHLSWQDDQKKVFLGIVNLGL